VLVASVRHPLHVVEAARAGADVATLPFKVLEQLWKHPLTDRGLEQFLDDWRKSGR
jgi:transaldolase